MTYLWRYRITDMHRIRETERLGVRLPASPPPRSPRALTAVRARGLKNGRQKTLIRRQIPIDCECPEPCRCTTTWTSKPWWWWWCVCGEEGGGEGGRGWWATRPHISSGNQQTHGTGHRCVCHVPCNISPPIVCAAPKPRRSGPVCQRQNHRLS